MARDIIITILIYLFIYNSSFIYLSSLLQQSTLSYVFMGRFHWRALWMTEIYSALQPLLSVWPAEYVKVVNGAASYTSEYKCYIRTSRIHSNVWVRVSEGRNSNWYFEWSVYLLCLKKMCTIPIGEQAIMNLYTLQMI